MLFDFFLQPDTIVLVEEVFSRLAEYLSTFWGGIEISIPEIGRLSFFPRPKRPPEKPMLLPPEEDSVEAHDSPTKTGLPKAEEEKKILPDPYLFVPRYWEKGEYLCYTDIKDPFASESEEDSDDDDDEASPSSEKKKKNRGSAASSEIGLGGATVRLDHLEKDVKKDAQHLYGTGLIEGETEEDKQPDKMEEG